MPALSSMLHGGGFDESQHPRAPDGKFGTGGSGKLDHGELNIPGRTSGINAQLDRYKAEQAKKSAASSKQGQASLREHNASVKQILSDKAWIEKKAANMKTTAVKISSLIKEMPYAHQQMFVNAYRKETA